MRLGRRRSIGDAPSYTIPGGLEGRAHSHSTASGEANQAVSALLVGQVVVAALLVAVVGVATRRYYLRKRARVMAAPMPNLTVASFEPELGVRVTVK